MILLIFLSLILFPIFYAIRTIRNISYGSSIAYFHRECVIRCHAIACPNAAVSSARHLKLHKLLQFTRAVLHSHLVGCRKSPMEWGKSCAVHATAGINPVLRIISFCENRINLDLRLPFQLIAAKRKNEIFTLRSPYRHYRCWLGY